jgi:vancomycin permeability regulator SanA
VRFIKPYLKYLLIGLVALIIARAIIIIYDGLSDETEQADVALIPGTKVENDGQPSERLKARLDGGIKIYKQGLVRKLIVSGGKGEEGFEEADVMKEYLLSREIPAEDIIADRMGYTTYESAINCRIIMKENNYKSVLVISQYFHISRTKLALRRAGIETIYSVHVPYYELRDIFSLFREVFAYYYYSFRSFSLQKGI